MRKKKTVVPTAGDGESEAAPAIEDEREEPQVSAAHLQRTIDALPVLIASVDRDLRYQFNNKAYELWVGKSRAEITGQTLPDVLGATLYREVAPYASGALQGHTVTYEKRLTWPNGDTKFVRGTYAPFRDSEGVVSGFSILVMNMTAQHEREEVQRLATERQQLLIAAQQEVAETQKDLDAVLEIVTRRAQQLSGADGAVVEIAEGDAMVYRAASGTAAAHVGMRLLRETSLSGLCVAEGRLLSCEDTETDGRVDRMACREIGVRSMVVLPLLFLGRTIGVLKVYAAAPHAFDRDALPLLELMVGLIIAAMSAFSEAEARQALSLSEARQQTLLQDVLLSVTEGKLLLCRSMADLPPMAHLYGDAIELTRTNHGLRAFREQARAAAQQAGHTDERQLDLVTAASEAGMNAIVHGGNGRGYVNVKQDGTVQLRIEDQGEGIAMEHLPKATLARGFSTKATLGHGIKMMLEAVDHMYLLTGPTGTTLVLEQHAVKPLPVWLSDVP